MHALAVSGNHQQSQSNCQPGPIRASFIQERVGQDPTSIVIGSERSPFQVKFLAQLPACTRNAF